MHMFTVSNLGLGLAGGAIIGLAVGLFMLVNGRLLGASGILAGVLTAPSPVWWENLAVLIGLPLGVLVFNGLGGTVDPHLTGSAPILIVAGLLVGFGTRMAHGCTSGHGVCGNARLSPRSIVATLLFIATGVAAVAVAGTK
jgi:uncharacterized membrane protein YedE/YeeE